MRPESTLIEVRDSSLQRVGAILPEHMNFNATLLFNGVGNWTVVLSEEHPLSRVLMTPGSGIVVTDLDTGLVILSGPTKEPEEGQTTDQIGGLVTVNGVTDDIVLSDMLAWPDPSNSNVTAQTKAYDKRTGVAETLMHAYVNANIGPSAPTARRRGNLAMGDNGARGGTLTKQARFETLGELLASIALVDGLGFRVVQSGSTLEFQTYLPVDHAREVRLSMSNSGLSSAKLVRTAPNITRAIVAGNGGSLARLFVERSNADSLDAEEAWGRRIERFVDQQSTRNLDELQRAGDEALAQEGFEGIAIHAIPGENAIRRFGQDWFLGDSITAEVNGVENPAHVIGAIIKIDADGARLGIQLGDSLAVVEAQAKLYNAAPANGMGASSAALPARVSKLERQSVQEDEWHTPTLLAGYVAGTPAPQYRVDSGNNLHMRGQVEVTSAADGAPVFNLADEYSPSVQTRRVIDTSPAATSLGRVIVSSGGVVTLHKKSTTAPTHYFLDAGPISLH